jgi:PKD domain
MRPPRQPTSPVSRDPKGSAFYIAILSICLCTISTTRAAWFDSTWPYRRPIDVTWDAEHATGNELATAEFYTAGHALPDARDIRVATDDGKIVPCHILMAGPGDRIRLVFSLQKEIKKYAVYFGNPSPVSPPPGTDDVQYRAGLLMETKTWNGQPGNNFEQIVRTWDNSGPTLGQTIIDRAFLGFNPFGDQDRTVSKIIGSLFAPIDGDYIFAMSVDDDGALYIDGQPLLFAPIGPSDTRYHATIHLTRGPHDFLLYHLNVGQDGRFAVGWQRPDTNKVDVIARESFGTCFGSQVGPLQQHDKPFLADFSIEQLGECFFADRYSYRYHFTAKTTANAPIKYHWDFGDGQTSTLPDLDHVYLSAGVYSVKLTATVGPNSDIQTNKIVVERNYLKIVTAVENSPQLLSQVVATYDLNTIPADELSRVIMLHLAAKEFDSAAAAADYLAAEKRHPDHNADANCLVAVEKALIENGRADAAIKMWDQVSPNSDIWTRAVPHAVQMALWWSGDFDKAVGLLKTMPNSNDPKIQRLLGQSLLLDGHPDEGKKILLDLPVQGPANREAALSGAAARSVEFFITESDAESGEDAWDSWQSKYPADFVEGYSVLLRVKLMELRKRQAAAAKLAEAFAANVPQSSYAPQLLDRAVKLLAQIDPAKSQALRQTLKEKYPEDPLSQN